MNASELVKDALKTVQAYGVLSQCIGGYAVRSRVRLSDEEIRTRLDQGEREISFGLVRAEILARKLAVAEEVIRSSGRESFYAQELAQKGIT